MDAGFDGGVAYLATEYVEGPDLAAVVRQAPLTGANLEALAIGVATALTAIHQAGVVHRDLKPSNVLLSPVGPRVIDFGIAQLAEPSGDAPATVAQGMGTPAYMSPEQARGEQATPASDVFSWGSLIAHAGTGRPPFGTGGVAEVVYRVIHHAPALDGLDERVRPLVERALDKDPARRPSAQQLMDLLMGRSAVPVDAATKAVSETWTPVVTPSTRQAPPPPPAGRRLLPTVLVGVAAAVLGVAATLAVLRPWEERGGGSGEPTVAATLDAAGSRLGVRIDALTRLGNGALDFSVSAVNLIPPGVAEPIHPARKNGSCLCTETAAASFNGGDQMRMYAIFENVPEGVDKVDVDLRVLGVLRDVPITPA
ncbi:serine/threonine-protein kinase [Nonomuraea wenchangensis]